MTNKLLEIVQEVKLKNLHLVHQQTLSGLYSASTVQYRDP